MTEPTAAERLIKVAEAKEFMQSKVADIEEATAEFKAKLSEMYAQTMGPALKKYLDAVGLGGIYIYGYTSNWCDGDPCTHNTGIGRVILKSVSELYLTRKGETTEYN